MLAVLNVKNMLVMCGFAEF